MDRQLSFQGGDALVPSSRCSVGLKNIQYEYRHLVSGMHVGVSVFFCMIVHCQRGLPATFLSFSSPSMAEMILGYPLFRGRDNNDQLTQIMRIIGTPDDRTLRKINADSVRFPLSPSIVLPFRLLIVLFWQPEITLRPFPKHPKQDFATLIPRAPPLGMSLL